MSWTSVWHGAMDALFPPRCLACHGLLGGALRGPAPAARTRDGFCLDCSHSVWPLVPGCPRCGAPPTSEESRDQTCGACTLAPPPYSWARSALVYGESVQRALIRLKHGGLRMAVGSLWQVGSSAPPWASLPWRPDLVVPVPLHARREQARGYNQAALLAEPVCRALNTPLAIAGLIRVRDTPFLSSVTRAQREESLRGAIVANPRVVGGTRVLVIDDVFTTGATTRACAAALERAGSGEVAILTVARVLG